MSHIIYLKFKYVNEVPLPHTMFSFLLFFLFLMRQTQIFLLVHFCLRRSWRCRFGTTNTTFFSDRSNVYFEMSIQYSIKSTLTWPKHAFFFQAKVQHSRPFALKDSSHIAQCIVIQAILSFLMEPTFVVLKNKIFDT